ncbi:MAG TPA: two-component regulator propeller domain-containing protein [Chitinophagaceae bacterium]|nr:two-component regulator propeller domain-containing protein [Chitinophagaceae bacterium]
MSLRKSIFTLYTLFSFISRGISQDSIPAIGQWRDHLPYHSAIDVAAGNNKIFCATPYSGFSIDLSENSVTRMSRVNGLHETGVSAICYNEISDKLFIGYRNSNIDIIYRNDIFNVPDIKLDNIVGDKNIYDVFSSGKYFYLSTGLGVIVIDADKYEVKDSWFIGNNGRQIKVNGFTADNSFFYAATDEGLKITSINTVDPANYLNWQNISGANGLSAGACNNVINAQGKIFALKNDSVFVLNGLNWNLFFTEPTWKIQNVNSSSAKIIVCQQKNDGSAKVTSLNTDGTIARTIQQPGLIAQPMKTILVNNNYWVADSIGGLTKFMSVGFENYNLNSPQSIATGEVVFVNNTFYAAAGSVNENWQKQNNKNGIYKFSEGQWTNYNNRQFAQLDSLTDLISIAIDPRDETIWAGSYGGGLLHIRAGNSFEIFKQNSPIGQTIFDPGSYRVSGLAFDKAINLWISNYGAGQNILVRKNDGNWKTFAPPFPLNENAVSQIIIDDEDQKWIVSPKENGLIVFNDNKTIDNATDDKWKLYRSGAGIGNLPTNNVLSIAKDKNGFIWIGTSDGIAVVQCPQNVFSSQGCDAVWPVVTEGGFNQYLFKGEEVRSIAVDGADRKWVATKNGAWLISPEGDKVIFRFTETNSPLLSNDVKRIAIDGKTGEIFFATANGICSFRSTATDGGETNSNVLVFPNPVPPGYGGTIAIRGLVNNAIVKITEMDGRLVYQAKALGGQAVWDGKDYKGKRISSGIYLVLISDDERKENLATKIVFISK